MIVVIANPVAGNRSRKNNEFLRRAKEVFQSHDKTEIIWTDSDTAATEIARSLSRDGTDLVVAAGGDGTIRQVAEGLVGSSVPLGVLPCGTENVLAKFAGLSFDPVKSAKAILASPVRRVDVGKVNEKIFLLFLGLGFDARAVKQTPRWLKEKLGGAGIVLTAARDLLKFNHSHQFKIDGEEVKLEIPSWQMLIGNIPMYGWRLPIFPGGSIVDGKLDARFFPRAGVFGKFQQVMKLVLKQPIPNGLPFQLRKVRIETDFPVDIQADGDWIGTTPCDVSVIPDGLRVRF